MTMRIEETPIETFDPSIERRKEQRRARRRALASTRRQIEERGIESVDPSVTFPDRPKEEERKAPKRKPSSLELSVEEREARGTLGPAPEVRGGGATVERAIQVQSRRAEELARRVQQEARRESLIKKFKEQGLSQAEAEGSADIKLLRERAVTKITRAEKEKAQERGAGLPLGDFLIGFVPVWGTIRAARQWNQASNFDRSTIVLSGVGDALILVGGLGLFIKAFAKGVKVIKVVTLTPDLKAIKPIAGGAPKLGEIPLVVKTLDRADAANIIREANKTLARTAQRDKALDDLVQAFKNKQVQQRANRSLTRQLEQAQELARQRGVSKELIRQQEELAATGRGSRVKPLRKIEQETKKQIKKEQSAQIKESEELLEKLGFKKLPKAELAPKPRVVVRPFVISPTTGKPVVTVEPTITEVTKIVIKEVPKIVEVDKLILKEVIKTVTKEVPKVIEQEVLKVIPKETQVVIQKTTIKEVEVEVIKEVIKRIEKEKIVEVPDITEVVKEVIKDEVDEVVKEVEKTVEATSTGIAPTTSTATKTVTKQETPTKAPTAPKPTKAKLQRPTFPTRAPTRKVPTRAAPIPFRLPSGRSLKPGLFPLVVRFPMGVVDQEVNLQTGSRRFISRTTPSMKSPQQGLRVISTTETRPSRKVLPQGLVSIELTPFRLSFKKRRSRNGDRPFRDRTFRSKRL